jgi:hypothetical protein
VTINYPNNPLVVLGPTDRYPVSLRVKLLRHFHDTLVGHVYVYSWLLNAFECHCQVMWMPDTSLQHAQPGADWVRWPTKLDQFKPYQA